MCFSEKASIIGGTTGLIFTCIGAYILHHQGKHLEKWALILWCVAINTMQIAEAAIWHTMNTPNCLGPTQLQYFLHIIQPIFFIIFLMVLYKGNWIAGGAIAISLYCIIMATADTMPRSCATTTPCCNHILQSYWTSSLVAVYFITFTCAFLALPRRVGLPLLVVAYGSLLITRLFYDKDSVWSVWCFVSAFNPVFLCIYFTLTNKTYDWRLPVKQYQQVSHQKRKRIRG